LRLVHIISVVRSSTQ